MENKNLSKLEKTIGYVFKDKSILKTALTHTSYVNENDSESADNERFEFFGDAIIEFFISKLIFKNHRDYPEGELTKLRASMVCESSLAVCAGKIRLGDYILMGHGEEQTGGRERASITSDAFEALVAAIYLDGGARSVSVFINKHLYGCLKENELFHDAKTYLQELVQKSGMKVPKYEIVKESGPAHAKVFVSVVYIGGEKFAKGQGSSKKAAEQSAAAAAIKKFNKNKKRNR